MIYNKGGRVREAIRNARGYQRVGKKILIVGAGGIGCQLIKNLYKEDYQITIIDYDTIAESNLNRQFCFRSSDIGRHKVQVLLQYFCTLDPACQTRIHIQKQNLFNYDELFFGQFDILMSALDNNEARWYLNQMAIDHGIPMIDAGTAGYNGQAQCFRRGKTECRMCRPQLMEAGSFALCTARGRPERNLHCVQFGVGLYGDIRGLREVGSKSEIMGGQWDTISKLFQKPINEHNKPQLTETAIKIHNIIFHTIPQNSPHKPNPIAYPNPPSPLPSLSHFLQTEQLLHSRELPLQFFSLLFVSSLVELLALQVVPEYDKDDFLASCFVFAAAGLRIGNFLGLDRTNLKPISYYECKDLSGKIVPAIASTNSIAAALETLFLLQLGQKQQKLSYLSIKGFNSQNKVQPFQPYKPKLGCPHCSPLHIYIELSLKMPETTWGELQDYLAQNLDPSLAERDLRCGSYIVIRNTGKKWLANCNKIIGENEKLVKLSRIGVRIAVLRYAGERGRCGWKIVLVDDQDRAGKIGLRKEMDPGLMVAAQKQIEQMHKAQKLALQLQPQPPQTQLYQHTQ